MIRFVVPFFMFGIAGCQTATYEIGTTPVTLSPAAAAGFESYKMMAPNQSTFAVSMDGKSFWYFNCQSWECAKAISPIRNCNKISKPRGSDCKIFAEGQEIVWKGPINFPELGKNKYLFSMRIRNPKKSTTTIMGGEATIRDDSPIILFDMKSGSSQCDGSADKRNHEWRISCVYRDSFSGKFVPGIDTLYEGRGESRDGKLIQFFIY